MKVMAQLAMVMNLDKCIGCHTCSVTCKQAWTNRGGVEYAWFNNVETRPGQGYPRQYQDQERWKGGWTLNKRGRLTLRRAPGSSGCSTSSPIPTCRRWPTTTSPWTYDYDNLLSAPQMDTTPVARPISLITGEDTKVTWGANWDDDLGGGPEQIGRDPVLAKVSDKVKLEFEQTFMFYLPRICEHCLNPSCAASCPSGAIYKRSEDGIVLVDQDKCRGWRQCVTGARTRRSTSTTRPARPRSARSATRGSRWAFRRCARRPASGGCATSGWCSTTPTRCWPQRRCETTRTSTRRSWVCSSTRTTRGWSPRRSAPGYPSEWIEAAQNSPVYRLIVDYQVALPLHPEYRTMPMVWYIPPLSPVVDVLANTGHDGEDTNNLFGAIDALRIPVEYLAELFTAGDVGPVRACAATAGRDALAHARR